MDKNLPANTGDTGLIPGLGRANMPMSNWARALEPRSHNYVSRHAVITEARVPRACALQQEKPMQWEATARRAAPTNCN